MNPATALARALLDELVHQGVRELVLSPGSRSAPLAFEALRLADLGRIQLHVRVDERSAGFLALGLAKVSGRPVAVACTSGTAVANLTPAVVEASYSAVPLVVLTADRPAEARGVGAPQTIDQVGFFGGLVRFSVDLAQARRSQAEELTAADRAARASAGMAIGAALGAPARSAAFTSPPGGAVAHAGPVHLNVGFRLPLVPDLPAADQTAADRTEALAPRPPSPPRPRLPPLAGCDHRDAREVLGDLPARGILLVGDLPCTSLRGHHQWLTELATACGWPIVSEPSANMHAAPTALAHGALILGSPEFVAAHPPDLVVSVGQWGLSRSTMQLVRSAARHVAIELPTSGREVCDPLRTAQQVLPGIPLPPAQAHPDPAWWARWRAADAFAAEVVTARLADPGAPQSGIRAASLRGSSAAARVWSALPEDALLLVAASWPVRQVEAFGAARRGLRVIGNRGANGIDGLVSTAWGAALAHQEAGGGPGVALLGDLAFLHDHNGLLVGAQEPTPDLVLVVLDNDGGGIFHQLEQGRPEYANSFERVFGTALHRDLVAVAQAAGAPAVRVTDLAGLDRALAAAMATGGIQVVVAHTPDRVAENDLIAAISRDLHARIAGM